MCSLIQGIQPEMRCCEAREALSHLNRADLNLHIEKSHLNDLQNNMYFLFILFTHITKEMDSPRTSPPTMDNRLYLNLDLPSSANSSSPNTPRDYDSTDGKEEKKPFPFLKRTSKNPEPKKVDWTAVRQCCYFIND